MPQTVRLKQQDPVVSAPMSSAMILAALIVFIQQSSSAVAQDAIMSDLGALPDKVWGAKEYYRLFTSAFIHGGFVHVAFNCWFLWRFCGPIERSMGSFFLVASSMWFAVVSALSEHIFLHFGIGLSGILFGHFGFAIVARRYRPAIQEVCTDSAITQISIWFVLCFFLTEAEIANIGNASHASGLVAGYLLGSTLFSKSNKWLYFLALIALTAGVGYLAHGRIFRLL